MYLNTEKKLDISQKKRSSKTHKNVAKGLLLRELGFKTGVVPNQFQAIAEDNLVTKNYEELRCRLPGVPRSTFLMVFSPDGKKVASTHGNHNVYVTDLTTGKNVNVLMGHPRTPWCIAFHPSSNQILASGCLGGQVRVWDLHGGSEVWTSHGQSVIASLAFHPTDRLLVIATYNELHFWDWSQPKPFAKCYTNNEKEKVRYVAFDPLGLKLVTGISNAPPLVSQWDRVGPTPMQTGPGTSQTLQGASSMHQPMAQRPPSAVPPPTSETERRISVCYRSLVEQYDQLVQRYFDLMRPRSIPTTDRGTDPMDLESETGTRNAEGSENSNATGASRRISDGWRTSSRNSSRTGLQSVYNEVLRLARRRSASTTTTPINPTTTSNTTTPASGPSFINQDSNSTRSPDTGQDVRAYCLRRTCAPRAGEQTRTFTPENPLRITASQSSAFRPQVPRTGEAEGANHSSSSSSTTSNSHDRSQQGRAERLSHLNSQNAGSRTSINRNRPFPDLGIRFGIQLLSRHIDNMQQLCRARLEILQLQQIRRVWEDLQRQIRSLHVAVRESGSSTTESASRNDESGGHIPSVSQMMEQFARISDSEPGSGRKRPFRNGPATPLNNFANKRKSKGNANEPSTSNSVGNVKASSEVASSDNVSPCNPSTSQDQVIPELPSAETSMDVSKQTIESETKDNKKHSNQSVSETEVEDSNIGTGTTLNNTNFTTLNCSTNRESFSNQPAESNELKDLNVDHNTASNIRDSSKSSNGRNSDKKLNSKTVNDLKSVTEYYSDNLSTKNSSSNIGLHSLTLNDQVGQASTSHTGISNNDSTRNNASITSAFRRFQQNQRSCTSAHRVNKIQPPSSANQIRRPWFLQSLAQSLRSCPRIMNSRLQGRSNCDNLEMGCDRTSQSSLVNKRAKRKKKKSKSSDNAHNRPGCSNNSNKTEKCASSKEVKLNTEGNKMGTCVSNDNDFKSSNFGPSTSTGSEQSRPRPDASAEPPFKIRKQNLKKDTDSTSASRDGTSSSSQPSCQRRHGTQGGNSSSSTCQCSTCNQESIWQIIHRLQELVQQQRERGPTSRSIPNSRSYRHRSSGISRRIEAWRSSRISRRIEAWRFMPRSSWVSHQTGSDSDSNPESERRAPWPWERRTSADRLTTALQNELYEVERLQELSSNLNCNSVNQSELVGRGNPRYRARQVLTLMVDSLTQFFEENDMSDRTSSGALDERVYNLYTLLQLALELTDLLLAQLFSTRRELENQWVNRLRSPVALDVSDNQQTHSNRERRPRASESYRLSLSNRRGVRHRQEGNPIGSPSSTETTPTRGRGWPRSRLVGWYPRLLPVAHSTSRSTSRLRLGRVAANRSLGRMTTPRRFTVPDPPTDYSPNEGGGEPRIIMLSAHGTSVRVAVPSPVRSPSPPREAWSYHGRVVYHTPEAQTSNPPPSDTFTVPTVQVNDVTVPESALNMQVPPPPRAHSPPPDVWNVIGPHQFQPPSGWVLRLGDVYFSEPPRPQSPPPFPTSAYFPRGFTVSVNRSHQPGWRSQLLTPRAPMYDHEEILAMHADSLIRGGDAVIITDAPLSPNHRIQVWDFSSYKIPDISNAEKNLIVSECKIHNDASVDVSKDGKLLVTLLPAARICVTTMLGVYSLQWESLGQCLYTTSFEQNAVSVSLSPACRHLLVGLASRRIVLPNDRLTVAQIFKLEGGEPGKMVGGRGRLCHMRDIDQSREHSYSSLNCIRWAPAPGQGLVYGTNVGQLRVLR